MSQLSSAKKAIEIAVQHYVNIANEKLNAGLECPRVTFEVRGTCGGRAHNTSRVDFNAGLLVDNLPEYLNQVVPHEVAHIVDHKLYGIQTKHTRRGVVRISHGKTFYKIMRVFGVREERCHKMDTSKVARTRKTQKFEIVCTGCGFEGTVGKKRRDKILAGANYLHRCGHGVKNPIKLA